MAIGLLGAAGIAAGSSLLAQGVGGLFSSRARKKAQRKRKQQMREDAALYGRMAGEDALQRAAAQQSINYVRDQIRDNANRRRGVQAVTGSTNAAAAAGAQTDSNAMARTVSSLAASADNRRDQLLQKQQAARDQYTAQQAASQERKGQETGQATAAVGSAIGNVAAQYLAGGEQSAAGKNPLENIRKAADTRPNGGMYRNWSPETPWAE